MLKLCALAVVASSSTALSQIDFAGAIDDDAVSLLQVRALKGAGTDHDGLEEAREAAATAAPVVTKIKQNRRCAGEGMKKSAPKEFGGPKDCAEAWAGQGIKYVAYWARDKSNAKSLRGVCVGWGEECEIRGIKGKNKNKLFSVAEETEPEVEAVGDPHMTLSDSEKEDLCCEGGHCAPCDLSLMHTSSDVNNHAEYDVNTGVSMYDDMDHEITSEEDQRPENMCKTGIKVFNICYDRRCGSTGQRPGGRNCGALPSGANGCCRSRITRTCTGPNMDRCRLPGAGSRGGKKKGKKGGKRGKKGGKRGKKGGKKGNGGGNGGVIDEAEAVGDPHLTLTNGVHQDLCCEGGVCTAC